MASTSIIHVQLTDEGETKYTLRNGLSLCQLVLGVVMCLRQRTNIKALTYIPQKVGLLLAHY